MRRVHHAGSARHQAFEWVVRILGTLVLLSAAALMARADDTAPDANKLDALVPALADHPYRLEPGPRPFTNRLSFSPAFGTLGNQPMYLIRATYNPSPWLGYEWSLGHNPAQSVHAALHSLSAMVRHPFPGRFQPYGVLGYGMMLVYPGRSVNADPVTKNVLSAGGGLEVYLRSDFALRAEMRYATAFGRERDHEGVVAYDYLQQNIGFSFYRTIHP
jgi:opacity protein-like surface antigen